ncbi:MAG: acetolactate synthase large subunit [Pseudomonadota bacterium]
MNGAEGLLETLANGGVEVCFANPGTSEMQLVAALDQQPAIRAVLCLFEGVVTGAADGYARMSEKPALTLLHLGPGLGNGLANLHNARRAHSPMINLVGDHATYHLQYDAPLTSDIDTLATPMSHHVRRSESPADLAIAGAEALVSARDGHGGITTLIAPADHAWSEGGSVADVPFAKESTSVPPVDDIADKLKAAQSPVLFLGGLALREAELVAAAKIAGATGARLVTETFCARLQRGEGRVAVERLPYFAEAAIEFLAGTDLMVCVGTEPPVAFFAYPDKASLLSPPNATVETLAHATDNVPDSLAALVAALDADDQDVGLQSRATTPPSRGPLDVKSVGFSLGRHIPEDAIVCDEGCTAGLAMLNLTAGAKRHDWLMLTGGSIGQGLPLAVGAAIACPTRKVLALQADGGGMYTLQALWTMAREQLDITTVILNNSSYAILNIEFARVGVTAPGPKAKSLLDLGNPVIDWCSLAQGMGVSATRAETQEAFDAALTAALAKPGPHLIEAIVPTPSMDG